MDDNRTMQEKAWIDRLEREGDECAKYKKAYHGALETLVSLCWMFGFFYASGREQSFMIALPGFVPVIIWAVAVFRSSGPRRNDDDVTRLTSALITIINKQEKCMDLNELAHMRITEAKLREQIETYFRTGKVIGI